MANSKAKGRRVELEIAKRFGVGRNKNDGTSHTDIHTPVYAIEVKAKAALPKWMHSAMDQAITDARGLTPVVVWVEVRPGSRVEYAMFRLSDVVESGSNA